MVAGSVACDDRIVDEQTATTKRPAPAPARRPPMLRFSRSPDEAVIAGVAAGLGARWGVDPMLVRIALVVLVVCGGVGVIAYLAAWASSFDHGADTPAAREPSAGQAVAFGLIVLGSVLVLRGLGVWFGDAVGIPILVAAGGAALIYVRTDAEDRPRWVRVGGRELLVDKPSPGRIVLGGLLVVLGMGSFLAAQQDLAAIGSVLLAVAVTAAGLGLAFGPLLWRLFGQVAEERRDRVRSEERAEVAAHLHDSVLQTLALIQRHTDDPRKMLTLARRQERELRVWLYGPPRADDGEHLSASVHAVAAEVEDAHDVPVEVVVVGDRPLDERTRAVVAACREAAANAARHSGADAVSVYVECEPGSVEAYVRDRGRGFDPSSVPPDRRGIADSIRGRIERHGGTVEILTAPGEGCEIRIRMPVEAT